MSLENNNINNLVIQTINKRRSCRDFLDKPIPKDILTEVIEAANQAPFVADQGHQPWRFVVVENPNFREKLVQTAHPVWKMSMDNMKDMMPEIYNTAMQVYEEMPEPKDLIYYSAPAIVFVISTANHTIDCGLACQNMMIAATSLGLGSCYVGFGAMITGNPEIIKNLEIQESEKIFGPILLGYPKDDSEAYVKNGLAHLAPQKKKATIKWI